MCFKLNRLLFTILLPAAALFSEEESARIDPVKTSSGSGSAQASGSVEKESLGSGQSVIDARLAKSSLTGTETNAESSTGLSEESSEKSRKELFYSKLPKDIPVVDDNVREGEPHRTVAFIGEASAPAIYLVPTPGENAPVTLQQAFGFAWDDGRIKRSFYYGRLDIVVLRNSGKGVYRSIAVSYATDKKFTLQDYDIIYMPEPRDL